MANNSEMVNLKRLIDSGKDKGYITYEELNDDLPDEVVTSEYLDDLMMMFEELDILVIDEASKEELEKSKKLKKKQQEVLEKENFQTEVADTGGRLSDPVKMYLKEMGCISLLTRDGEVEIAKRIEAGEKEGLKALLKCCVGIEYIIELGNGLKEGKVKIKDVINDLEDEESHAQIGEKRDALLQLVEDINQLHQDSRSYRHEMSKKGCSAANKKKLITKLDECNEQIANQMSSFKLEKTQLDYMVIRLREIVEQFEDAEKAMTECMLAAGGKPLSYLKKHLSQIPSSSKANQLLTPLKMKKSDLLALKSKLEKAEKQAESIRTRTHMGYRELKETLQNIEEKLTENRNG